ncbi:MAG: MBL fold metallo-hydrolase [Planctomycetota bacterium]|jgi:ribonuclease Z
MPSHNLARIKIDEMDIIGYSVAGEETVVAVPQLDVCFDVGKAPDQIIPINNVLLTHGHMDHAAGLAYYLSQRNFCGISAGTILAPDNLLPPMRQIIDAWSKLDGNKIPAKLVGLKPGDEYKIKPNLVARAFPTKHSKGSLGFTVIEKRKKLKTEYTGLSGPQIVELKKQGIEIEKYITESKILIAECTFYEDEHTTRAKAGKHMHVDELATLLNNLNNEHIIITHTTQRTPMREIRKILKNALPKDKYDRITILMAGRSQSRAR